MSPALPAFAQHSSSSSGASCRDQRLYAQDMQPDGSFSAPRALTPPNCGCRFADGVVDERRRRLLLVCEDHSPQALQGGQPQNIICAVGRAMFRVYLRWYPSQACL